MDHLLIALGGALLLLIVLAWLRRALARWRQSRYFAGRAREHREKQRAREMQLRELHALAAQIEATSSTSSIIGYRMVRQIEAVFSDGHATPAEAVEGLKAVARLKGANAIINLASERSPSGKCAARGDAVVVKPLVAPRPESESKEKPQSS